MKPHLVKIIEDSVSRARKLTVPKESYRIPLKQENIDIIKNAMVGVTTRAARRRARSPTPATRRAARPAPRR
jgi:penicillin-binding protein 2